MSCRTWIPYMGLCKIELVHDPIVLGIMHATIHKGAYTMPKRSTQQSTVLSPVGLAAAGNKEPPQSSLAQHEYAVTHAAPAQPTSVQMQPSQWLVLSYQHSHKDLLLSRRNHAQRLLHLADPPSAASEALWHASMFHSPAAQLSSRLATPGMHEFPVLARTCTFSPPSCQDRELRSTLSWRPSERSRASERDGPTSTELPRSSG